MKRRNGFVSNSSSSSFIVAIRKAAECPHCGHGDLDFLRLVEAGDCDTFVRSQGLKAVLEAAEEILDDYDIESTADPETLGEWEREALATYLQLKNENWDEWELAHISLGQNSGELWALVLQQAENSGSIKVLSGEFG